MNQQIPTSLPTASRTAAVWAFVRWPLGLGMIGLLFFLKRGDLVEFASRDKNWGMLAAALALCIGAMSLTFIRWHALVRALGFPFRLWDAFCIGSLGMCFTYVGPGLVGGDMFKAVYVARGQTHRRATVAATVFLDRILGMLGLFQLGAVAALFTQGLPDNWQHRTVFWILWAGAAAGSAGVLLLLLPGATRALGFLGRLPVVGRVVGELLESVKLYQARPMVLVFAVAVSVLGHMAMIGSFYCCALGLGGWAPPLTTHFYFMPFAEVLGVLIPTPGGMGSLEFALQQGYAAVAVGVTPAEAATAGLFAAAAFRVVNVLTAALGGLLYFAALGGKTISTTSLPRGADDAPPSNAASERLTPARTAG